MVSSITHYFLGKALSLIVCLYGLSVIIAAPYFDWKYAQEYGFRDWLAWGEVAPTASSLVWPYFALHQLVSAQSAAAAVQSSSRH